MDWQVVGTFARCAGGGGGGGSAHNREDNDTGDDESFRPLCFVQVQVGSVVLSTANGMMTRIGHST